MACGSADDNGKQLAGPSAGVSAPSSDGLPIREPVGREIYLDRLHEAAGMEIAPEALSAHAEHLAKILEERLQAVSETILADVPWRDVFSQMQREHPQTADAALELYREEIDRAEEFVRDRNWVPMPEQGVEVVEIRNPLFRRYFALAMYLDGRMAVTLEPAPDDPAITAAVTTAPQEASGEDPPTEPNAHLAEHCDICVPPLAVHEVYPGHHVAFSRVDSSAVSGAERLAANRRNVVYHEGWGLYAELLMLQGGYYAEDARRELGALRLLYLRVLRASIDPALHLGELTATDAEETYREIARMSSAAARAEVERHLRDPVLKASYFLGLCQILELRQKAFEQGLDLPTFHARFLGLPKPIPRIAEEVFGVELTLGGDWAACDLGLEARPSDPPGKAGLGAMGE